MDHACSIEFLPLHVKEAMAKLSFSSNELGLYHYELRLVSTHPNPERNLQFKVGLGGSQMLTFRFLSFSKVKTEFNCRIDSPDFTVEKTISAPAGESFIAASILYFGDRRDP
jgi:hydrocephalus-inducing protein